LLKKLWIEGSYLVHVLEQPEVNSKKQEKEKSKTNLRRRQVETKKEASQEVIPEPPIKIPTEHIPEPMVETKVKKEVEPAIGEKLPAANPNAILSSYLSYEPAQLPSNPLLSQNNQLDYAPYISLYISDPMSDVMTPHFQQSRPDIPRPIFNHCAIHAGIAYFIQAIQKREVLFDFLILRKTMNTERWEV